MTDDHPEMTAMTTTDPTVPTATHDPNPVATARQIRHRAYLAGPMRRTDTGETRQLDTRWTPRQERWCRSRHGMPVSQLMATGTSLDTARLAVAADTLVVFWELAGLPQPTGDIEQLLDLRADQIEALFDMTGVELITADDDGGGDGADPTVPAGGDG